ncbi:hypothetical protein N7517_009143 [Penicillium concentricum]|uniref:Uncharacterized protein n=1 Tax=Penicillium concentricum TaxID=293559 RepID=A0A9W9UWH1_9EURO|nr:uncharacterized protein N7517_009143 [Penicillium concentricum]KAJ5359952.1 hypothetical protein N7517_009143 [Penicillium concentricum]
MFYINERERADLPYHHVIKYDDNGDFVTPPADIRLSNALGFLVTATDTPILHPDSRSPCKVACGFQPHGCYLSREMVSRSPSCHVGFPNRIPAGARRLLSVVRDSSSTLQQELPLGTLIG